MIQEQHTLFEEFAHPLVGLLVSHAWRGHGSAIFLEFGALTLGTRVRRDGSPGNPDGEAGLMIEWGWRIEGRRSVLCGCSTEERRWPQALACLIGSRVAGVALLGRLPEINLALSSGIHVASFMTAQGDPQWTLFDRRGGGVRWLHVRAGRLCVEVSERHAQPGAASQAPAA